MIVFSQKIAKIGKKTVFCKGFVVQKVYFKKSGPFQGLVSKPKPNSFFWPKRQEVLIMQHVDIFRMPEICIEFRQNLLRFALLYHWIYILYIFLKYHITVLRLSIHLLLYILSVIFQP